jgi:hypothetical protein
VLVRGTLELRNCSFYKRVNSFHAANGQWQRGEGTGDSSTSSSSSSYSRVSSSRTPCSVPSFVIYLSHYRSQHGNCLAQILRRFPALHTSFSHPMAAYQCFTGRQPIHAIVAVHPSQILLDVVVAGLTGYMSSSDTLSAIYLSQILSKQLRSIAACLCSLT